MSLNHDIARSHLETLIERITGIEKALPDQDGDYFIRTANAGFYTRVDGDEPPVFRVFTVVVDKVDKTPELLDALNDINKRLTFLRAMWAGNQIMIEGETLGLTATIEDFDAICGRLSGATDHFGAELIDRFGGQPFFEQTKDVAYKQPESSLPGYL